MKLLILSSCLLVAISMGAVPASANPGDQLGLVNVPYPTSTLGVSVAVNCDRVIFYTNYQDPYLYKTDKTGAALGVLPLTDSVTGGPVTLGEMSYDNTIGKLWAGTDNQTPQRVYIVDMNTGVCTYMFSTPEAAGGFPLVDGLGYDAGDNTIWVSPDVSTDIFHYSPGGAYLGSITPLDPGGNPFGSVSGVTVGLGNTLYIGRNGFGQIVRINKSTGAYIASFATPGGRDEGLECDQFSFFPKWVLWSKDAYNNTITAIEVDPATCGCGGVTPATPSSWGRVKDLYR